MVINETSLINDIKNDIKTIEEWMIDQREVAKVSQIEEQRSALFGRAGGYETVLYLLKGTLNNYGITID